MVEQKGPYLPDDAALRIAANMRTRLLDDTIARIAEPFGLDEVLFRLDSIAYLAKELGHCEHQIPSQLEIIARIIRTYQPCDWIDAVRLIETTYLCAQSFLHLNPEKYGSAPRVHSFLMEVESSVRDSRSITRLEVALNESFLGSSPSTFHPPSSAIPSYRTEGQLNAIKKIDPDYHPRYDDLPRT